MKKLLAASITLLICLGFHHDADAETLINFNDFSSDSGYTLLGTAKKDGNKLQLVPSTINQVGGAFFNTPVTVSSFSTRFSFTFSNPGAGDGMMFVIKNPESSGSYKTTELGYTGEAIAYGDRYGVPGIRNSVGIEFDSHYNTTAGVTNDINGNHIGIDANGSMLSLAQVAVASDFNSANPWYAWVDYDGAILSVSVNQTGIQPATAMLSYGSIETPFVISDYTGSSTALVGFTASTGGAVQTTTLNSFGFDSVGTGEAVPEPSTLALLGTGAVFAGIASRRKSRKTGLAG